MPEFVNEADIGDHDGYEVVFIERWVDLTVHGRMVTYDASPIPVLLVGTSADAAIASGKAVLPRNLAENESSEAEQA